MQVEGATNLHLLPPFGCLVSIGFAKISGGSGGYARLIAICPADHPHGVTIDEAPGAPLPKQPAPLRRVNGVLTPSPGATPTTYCDPALGDDAAPLGCPKVWRRR